jgi:enolase-phosphatase E1
LFSGYFDTRIGGKKEAGSYSVIARQLRLEPGDILFLSDVREELDAARAAGLGTWCIARGEGPAVEPGPHPVARDFDAVHWTGQ